MKEKKLKIPLNINILAINKNTVDLCRISLDIKCCYDGADLNQLLFALIVKSMPVHSLRP